jgi:hypothetical protein
LRVCWRTIYGSHGDGKARPPHGSENMTSRARSSLSGFNSSCRWDVREQLRNKKDLQL